MPCRLPLIAIVVLVACGDSGPDPDSYIGLWRLTSVNTQPLPSGGNTISQLWVAGVLQLNQQTGSYDWCWEDPSTSTRTSHADDVVLTPINGDRIEVSYFGRRAPVPDTVAVNGAQLTFRSRNVSVFGEVQAVDVLTFVRLPGELPPACSLAPGAP
jgi:hypothetical protein